MKKFSALIIMKRMNLWHRIFSISSACKSNSQRWWSQAGMKDPPTCLTAMLTLTELMDPSIRTFSLSLRLIITGWRSSSLLLLKTKKATTQNSWICPEHAGLRWDAGAPRTHRTSTSGLLCLSTTWEEKFSRQRAACRVARTALRYGRKVAVWERGYTSKQLIKITGFKRRGFDQENFSSSAETLFSVICCTLLHLFVRVSSFSTLQQTS